MTTLAQDTPRDYELGEHGHYPVIAGDIIYEGAAVGLDSSGYARPLVAGDVFAGFARDKVDNASGLAGAKYSQVNAKGKIKLSVSGLVITDIGRPVYAGDDNSFALTGNGTFIGRIVRYVSAGVGIVQFDVAQKEEIVTVSLPIDLANITGAGDVVTDYTPGFAGRIIKNDFVVNDAVTTASKAATLNAEIGSTNVTGGTLALTSANATPLGVVVGGAAVTAANAFEASDTISIEAASVTAFSEGSGYILLTLGK